MITSVSKMKKKGIANLIIFRLLFRDSDGRSTVKLLIYAYMQTRQMIIWNQLETTRGPPRLSFTSTPFYYYT